MTPHETAARQLAALEQQHADLEERITQLRRYLIDTADTNTIHLDGQPMWHIRRRRTFNTSRAIETLPPETLAAITTPKIDGTLLKKLSPALWETCTTEGDPYLTKATR
jgi:hypothetical protein